MNDLMSESFVMNIDQCRRVKDIELGSQLPENDSTYGMEEFFKKRDEIEQLMEKLSQFLQKLQEANEESKSVTKASAMKAIKQRMEKDVDEVGKIARTLKIKLEEIDRDNLINQRKPGCGKGTSVDRSRMGMTGGLKNKLRIKMNEFQKLRQNIQEEYREVVERRVFTVTGTQPTEEMIDRLIDTGNSEQIFQRAVQELGRGLVIDTLEEIQERHDGVKEIEKKLLDLHQVFMDMAILTEAQGEMLNDIENQVANPSKSVATAPPSARPPHYIAAPTPPRYSVPRPPPSPAPGSRCRPPSRHCSCAITLPTLYSPATSSASPPFTEPCLHVMVQVLSEKMVQHQGKNIKGKAQDFHADDVGRGGDGEWRGRFTERESCTVKKSKTERLFKKNRDRARRGKIDLDPAEVTDTVQYRFQEIVPLNAGNVLGTEDNGPAKKWVALIRKTLNILPRTSSSVDNQTPSPVPNPIVELDDNFEGTSSRQKNSTFFNRRSFQSLSRSLRMDGDIMAPQPRLERRYSVCERAMYRNRPSDFDANYRGGGSSDDENAGGDSPGSVFLSPMSYG